LLDGLADTTRFAGSAEESRARALCRDELEKCGFSCNERKFEFSEWPARWGPPLATLIQAVALIFGARLAARGYSIPALVVVGAALAILGGVGASARRYGVMRSSYARSSSVNLQATRGTPSVWLVAHLDSKSQTIPMLVRIASSVGLQLVSVLVVAAIASAALGVTLVPASWLALQLAAGVAALPTILCFVRNDSPGAVDNASGVVAALVAASQPGAPQDLGILITSAEELGLAGARAWATDARQGIKAINCDTVDDIGGWRCMYSGHRPTAITTVVARVAAATGLSVRTGRLIPGILADNVAFADAGIDAVTLSRGNFSTLARIHTWRDNSIAQTGRGAAEAGVLLSTLAKELS